MVVLVNETIKYILLVIDFLSDNICADFVQLVLVMNTLYFNIVLVYQNIRVV